MCQLARYTDSDLTFIPLSELNSVHTALVFNYIRELYPRDNNKNPVPSALWVFEHGVFRYPSTIYQPPHQIYTGWLNFTSTPALVDIAGLVPDDQGVAADEKLAEEDEFYFGFFGGHRVHPDYRGRGIGSSMIRHRIGRLQGHVNQTQRPASAYAFFDNPVSGRNLAKARFENRGERFIKHDRKMEWVYRLLVTPAKD